MQPNKRWRGRLTCWVIGAAMALGHAPFDLWFVTLPALIYLMMRLSTDHDIGRFSAGWWTGLGYFAVALHWIVEPFLVDIARHGWMAPFALVFLSAVLALFWAVAFWAAGQLTPSITFSLPIVWTLSELARSTILTGFPWALIAYVWVETPIAQAAAYFGPHVLGAVTLGLASLTAWLFTNHRRLLWAPCVALSFFWILLDQRVPTHADLTQTVVRLVQPNAAQHLKWRPGMLQTFFDRQLAATSAPGTPDLVVWPEAAVPYLFGQRPDLDHSIAEAAPASARVLIGIRKYLDTQDPPVWRNSLAVLGDTGAIEATYDKHHLVPFGEYLPLPSIFETLGLQALAANAGQYTSGPGPALISVDGLPSFQPLICYEAIFPGEILNGDQRPDWLLHITNDAWFGKFSGPFQHLDQARMRAVEQGLPLARAANTGISAMIDPYGRITDQLALNTQGHLDAQLPEALPPTLYARTGNRFWGLILGASLLLVVVISRRVIASKPINLD